MLSVLTALLILINLGCGNNPDTINAPPILSTEDPSSIEASDFRTYLRNLGVPDSYMPEAVIGSQSEANDIASEYFVSTYLPNNGIPAMIISQFDKPINQNEADAIAIEYFNTIYLPSKGIPLNSILGSPITIDQANSFASTYFLEIELPSRGIPLNYILNIEEPPISSQMADNIARDYFSLELIDRGVSEDHVISRRLQLTSLIATDETAQKFFKLRLLLRGVDISYVESYYDLLLSQPIADEIEALWIEEKTINEERDSLVADLVFLQGAINAEQLTKLNEIQVELDDELLLQVDFAEEELTMQLETEMVAIERGLYICSVVGFVPLYGDIRDFKDVLGGEDSCTGDELAAWEKVLNLFSIFGFVDIIKGADRTLELFDSVKTINQFVRLARSSDDIQAINRIIDIAHIYERGDTIERYIELLRQLERTDDLTNLGQAAVEFSNSVEFLAVVSALDRIKSSGLIDLAISPKSRGVILNDLQLEVSLSAFRNSERYETIMALVLEIDRLPKIDILERASSYLTDQRKVARLTDTERVFRSIGGINAIDDGIDFLRQVDAFRIITRQLDSWEDYTNFVRHFSPIAKRGLWRDRALFVLENNYLQRFVLRQLNRQLLVYVEDNQTDSPTTSTKFWIIETYDPEENLNTLRLETQLETLEIVLGEGHVFAYFFDSQPDDDMINLIETSGGEIYWAPNNLP